MKDGDDRMGKDLLEAAEILTGTEARYLVDSYYRMQDQRIRTENQERAMTEMQKPHAILSWLFDRSHMLEKQVKRALKRYAESDELGVWAMSQKGIGPVIAAGLLAHIDLRRAITAGAVHRYAGLDPTVVWAGKERVRVLIADATTTYDSDMRAFLWVCGKLNQKPLEVLHRSEIIERVPSPEEALAKLEKAGLLVSMIGEPKLHADNLIRDVVGDWPGTGAPPAAVADRAECCYRAAIGKSVRFNWTAISKILAKRPWNADLKVLCWKMGESFAKVSTRDGAFYGHLYAERRVLEISRNLKGDFSDQAVTILATKKIGKDKDAYYWYSGSLTRASAEAILAAPADKRQALTRKLAKKAGSGVPMLSPGHIYERVKRYSVKLFLSHYHLVGYRLMGREPPVPYAIAHLGHAHMIEPPNAPPRRQV